MSRSRPRRSHRPPPHRRGVHRRRNAAWALLGVIACLFVVSRVRLAGNFAPDPTDLPLYARYALESELAARQHQTLYAFHQRLRDDAEAFAHELGHERPKEGIGAIEYPPLALAFIALPAQTIVVPEHVDAAAWRSFADEYARNYRCMMGAIDVAIFVLLSWLLARLYADEPPAARAERLVLYLLGGLALCPVLYDRLDLALGGVVLAALALLLTGGRAAWTLGLVALAVDFKLVPLVLAPLFVLGTVDVATLGARSWLPPLAALAGRAALLALFIVGLFAPFLLLDGAHALDFLGYHAARGLQIESLAASLVMVASLAGGAARVVHEQGAFDLQSPMASLLARLSPLVVASTIGALTAQLFLRSRRLALDTVAATAEDDVAPSRTVAGQFPRLFCAYAVATLMLAMAGSKVFSPQYLLWILPLAPLVPFAGGARDLFSWTFAALCLLTTMLFPYHYADLILGARYDVDGAHYGGPSPLGIAMLGLRNVGFAGLTLAMLVHLRARVGARALSSAGRSP